MKFDLRRPCAHCPFRADEPLFLGPERVAEILEAITTGQQTFACHETTDGGTARTADTQHCAGAMILLERMERPNQMMRIAERLELYDRRKLDMAAPVYQDAAAMQAAAEKPQGERR